MYQCSGSQSRVILVPSGHWAKPGDAFHCHKVGGRWHLPWGPEKLLKVLSGTGRLPTKNYPFKNVSSVEVEKSCTRARGIERSWLLRYALLITNSVSFEKLLSVSNGSQ